jgi:hypothetical protein
MIIKEEKESLMFPTGRIYRPGWGRPFASCFAALFPVLLLFVSPHLDTQPQTGAAEAAPSADLTVTARVAPPPLRAEGAFLPGLPAGQAEPLVKVEVSSPEAWELLRSLGAELYLRGDRYAIVKLRPESIMSLNATGLEWKALRAGWPGQFFYIVPDGESLDLAPFGCHGDGRRRLNGDSAR